MHSSHPDSLKIHGYAVGCGGKISPWFMNYCADMSARCEGTGHHVYELPKPVTFMGSVSLLRPGSCVRTSHLHSHACVTGAFVL